MWSDTRPSSPGPGPALRPRRGRHRTRDTRSKPTNLVACFRSFYAKTLPRGAAGSAACLLAPHVFTWRTFPSLSFSLSLSLSLFPVPEVSPRSSVAYVQPSSSRQKDNPASFRHLAKQGAPGSRLETAVSPRALHCATHSKVSGDKMKALCQLKNIIYQHSY